MCDVGTPGPIPNPVVKPFRADGSWGASPCESRSSPTKLFAFNGKPDRAAEAESRSGQTWPAHGADITVMDPQVGTLRVLKRLAGRFDS